MEISNKKIDNGQGFDWGRTSAEYARYRDIYPKEFYEKLAELSLGVKGQNILDIGTGTGVIPRNMYGYGADWTGVDISENQISYAKQLSQQAGMNIRYLVSAAEDIDFPDESFDAIIACQCFMYFDQDILLPKIHRMLKKDGHFAVLYMAWLPEESEIARTSEELVLKYNPSWTGAHQTRYPLNTPPWCGTMFEPAYMQNFDLPVTFNRDSWHGRIKACRGIGASSLSRSEIEAWESEHKDYLQTVPEVFDILHYVSILDVKKADTKEGGKNK